MRHERWAVLAVLIGVRTSMGFQFQSVGAVSPLMIADLGISYTELGTLIGLSRDLTDIPAAPFVVAGVLMLVSLLALGAFCLLRRNLKLIGV